ncbi:hypothetical protein [Chryseosolibacter indicus]|nr:hypothetical protein [Chryseosolibacter indicus]
MKQGSSAVLRDLLKYTLMDLLLKQVLITETITRKPSRKEPERSYKYIKIGANFSDYAHKPHELVYLSMFKNNSYRSILFRNLIKIGYENAKGEKQYHNKIKLSHTVCDAFSSSLLRIVFGGVSYSNQGKVLKRKVEIELEEVEKKLANYTVNNKYEARKILQLIAGNIFLIPGYEVALSQEIDEVLMKELTTQDTSSGCSTGCWSVFDTIGSCSSDSSGCSSDSGCSSGCSGCGGCGGD